MSGLLEACQIFPVAQVPEFRSCTNYGAKRNNYHKNIKSSFLSHCIFPFKRLCIDWGIGQLKIFDPVAVLPVASDFETCPGMY